MPQKLLTIVIHPASEGKPREKTTETTVFVERWSNRKVSSKWYFQTRESDKVFLKVGWNLFGRRKSNHIQIKERRMKSCELMIFVSWDQRRTPALHSISDHVILDGIRIGNGPDYLYHGACVAFYVKFRHLRKLVIMKFFSSDKTDGKGKKKKPKLNY